MSEKLIDAFTKDSEVRSARMKQAAWILVRILVRGLCLGIVILVTSPYSTAQQVSSSKAQPSPPAQGGADQNPAQPETNTQLTSQVQAAPAQDVGSLVDSRDTSTGREGQSVLGGDTASEHDFTEYGFVRNNFGAFTGTQPFAHSHNNVATARSWARGYTDFKISDKLRLWSTVQFAFEPEYSVEKNAAGRDGANVSLSRPDGKEYSEYNRFNDVLRELWVEWRPTKKDSIKAGRQIAIWGESLTERVGDVIHPEDDRFSLAFVNLEDTRVPSWMLRATHDFERINSSIEFIVNPNWVGKEYRVNRLPMFAITTGYAYNGIYTSMPGQRFAINVEDRYLPPLAVGNAAIFGSPDVIVAPPFSRDWIQLPPGIGPGNGWVPTAFPAIKEIFPEGAESLRGGFRTSTFLHGYQFGVSYFHTQNYDPLVSRGDLTGQTDPLTGVPFREYGLVHPNVDILGFYMNKNLPWPGVIRTEAIYEPNKPFNTFNQTVSNAIVTRSYLKYMVAYDLTGFLYFRWHKTAPFDVTFEHVGEVVPDNKNLQYIIYATQVREFNPRFNTRIATNWSYNKLSTEVIASYFPWGHSGLLMPIVKYMPAWANQKLSFEVRYINVFGNSNETGLGILRSKDMVVFTTQLDWSLHKSITKKFAHDSGR